MPTVRVSFEIPDYGPPSSARTSWVRGLELEVGDWEDGSPSTSCEQREKVRRSHFVFVVGPLTT